jgi:Lrp/AsnC family leucine-responsive transcriptional regulator
MTGRRADLDQIDRKILNELQRDSRLTNARLAELAGTSAPSCLRRVRRLREEGYIEREIALVNLEKVGSSLVSISEVRLNNHDRRARDEAIRLIRAIPEVIICYNVTGERDLVFIAVLTDMADFEAKITEPLGGTPVIKSINSYFAIKTVKFQPFVNFSEGR